ncbi:NAD(P)H-hydrate epimerase, partial [Desulforudis sp. 1190]|uniref:NAD(P)H-hydrate epimerase n=1 Tax=Desulforudis sp. 1190 TaxID=3416136 RepID=UPI003CF344D5
MRVVTAAEMRSIDHRAGQDYGIPSLILMENAGIAVCRVALDMLGTPQGKVVLVVAGRGNNGGDGFVAARHLHLAGAKVKVLMTADSEAVIGEARTNLDIWLRLGQKVYDLQDRNGMQVLQLGLMQADLVIDAIYGTGFRGALKDKVRRIIELINESGKPVLAVDVPSGVEADTGKTNGLCVRAAKTVTFGLPKLGLVLDPGASFAGEVQVEGISLPPDLLADGGTRFLLTPRLVGRWMTPRSADAHKGDFGHVLIVAG